MLGPPMTFDKDTSDAAIARDCAALKTALLDLQEKADGMVGLKMEGMTGETPTRSRFATRGFTRVARTLGHARN